MRVETIVGLFVTGALLIFLYLSFSIGTFRFDMARYHSYRAYFDDTSGLEKKDPVKIAGVEVGYVENIIFNPATRMAEVEFWLDKSYVLPSNSRPYIRQEGLLGNKFLEVMPGDPSTGTLLPGGALGFPTTAPPTISELLTKFGDIATSIQSVASSLEKTLGTPQGETDIKDAISGLAKASNRMASFAETLDKTIIQNEENIHESLKGFREAIHDIKIDMPKAARGITNVTTTLNDKTLPSFTENWETLSGSASNAFGSVDDASIQAREGLKEASEVLEKVNAGRGFIGKLVNEDEIYQDLRATMQNFKGFFSKFENFNVLLDMHSETDVRNWNSKGYLQFRFCQMNDIFYLLEIAFDERGTIRRERTKIQRFDCKGAQIPAPRLQDQYRSPDEIRTERRKLNNYLFGLQFAKRFDRVTMRVGFFENTFGFALDWYVPLPTEHLHWVSTLELYDWQGINQFDDKRPRIKWLNRMFLFKNFYATFGMDYIIGKNNASAFFGAGLRV